LSFGPRSVSTIEIRIGTRGSPLALWQANEVRRLLAVAHGLPSDCIDIRIIKTTGDRIQDRSLSEVGGKGLFTREIEEALLGHEIDLAVHSMKDVATVLPKGLGIAALLPREDVRDAFISQTAASLSELPTGAVVGTASLRRGAQVKRLRSDCRVVVLRGNVETRLRKVADGEVDATLLAMAGLNRLGLEREATAILSTEHFLPAVAQGAIGIETRIVDERTARLLAPIHHAPTALCIAAERAFLAALEGSCRTPIAGLADVVEGGLTLRGMILATDGSQVFETLRRGGPDDGPAIGRAAAEELLAMAGPGFLAR
jgi:hydroxymethylbilane synthase